MSETDTPLKQLFNDFGKELAEWLLNTPIKTVRNAAAELPPVEGTTRADYVLELTLPDDRQILFHVEFQGRSSKRPMSWRMLDYNSRLAEQSKYPVCSTVIYLGKGAGIKDTGKHHIQCPITGQNTLSWHYQVLHLWQLDAETLLALNNPVLLTLIGQTKVSNPSLIFPQVLAKFRQENNVEKQARLLRLFTNLLCEEEWFTMIEQLISDDEILNTAGIRREWMLRQEGKREGLQEGLQEEAQTILRLLLEKRFAHIPPWVAEKLQQATKSQLENWTLRVLDAQHIEQIFDV